MHLKTTGSAALLLGTVVPITLFAAQSPTAAAPGYDMASLDPSAQACTDFYQYACGGWMAKNPIPADQSTWGRFNELADRNLATLRSLLERSGVKKERNANEQKTGDFYASCMDETAVNAKGVAPLKPALQRIAAVKDKSELPELLGFLHVNGSEALFAFSADADMKNAKQNIAAADQGGLGLPERDYYLRDDAKSVELRANYVKHVTEIFRLAGDKEADAAAKAKVVMEIETKLAKASLDMVSRRDPSKLYHKLSLAELQQLSPSFAWDHYFAALAAAPKFDSLNVGVPEFLKGMEGVVKESSLADLKTYLTWHLLHATAPVLSKPFVDANFEFFGKTLTGAKELRPRWKRCVQYTDEVLGEALGKIYVEQTFGAEGKKRVVTMVQAIESALGSDIDAVTWMTPATKQAAHAKLAIIANKIGYPDKWRDYSALSIVRGDLLGNFLRGTAFEVNRNLKKIGTPVDPMEWEMSPPTVNAYFQPQQNNINFPAGILQPPFFNKDADDAINFGGIGAVIAHELTHGFDDEGRQFDAEGNLRDWWTTADGKAFDERAECLVKQYGDYTAVDDVKLNGKLTLGENVADNGGMHLSYLALMASLGDQKPAAIDGFTPEQRFFLGWAQVWCQNVRPEAARMRAQTDPHSPGRYRVNGVVGNMPEFAKAFGCKADAPVVRREPCRVW
jgi:putative endopeptidase